jgi:hypothetical protein
MTTKNSRSSFAIAAELSSITTELEAARADMALLERLKSAADRVSRLSAEHDKATAALNAAKVREAKAKEDARFAGIEHLAIDDTSPDANLVRSNFKISYARPTWDGRATVPRHHTASGFSLLDRDVLSYIIERCPERIPHKIMALAPDNPRLAFDRYFVSLRRGYVAA